jgi:hypothetical protein
VAVMAIVALALVVVAVDLPVMTLVYNVGR